MGMMALDGRRGGTPDIVIEGKDSVFNYPEFSDIDKLREIVQAFEEKGRIVQILDRVVEVPGSRFCSVKKLAHVGMHDFSMVASEITSAVHPSAP